MTIGDPMDETTDMGPISDERIMAKVVRHVDGAVAEGATVVLYGVENLVVVSANGLTLVTTVDRATDLKALLDTLPTDVRDR